LIIDANFQASHLSDVGMKVVRSIDRLRVDPANLLTMLEGIAILRTSCQCHCYLGIA
jgi:hypothetical protein